MNENKLISVIKYIKNSDSSPTKHLKIIPKSCQKMAKLGCFIRTCTCASHRNKFTARFVKIDVNFFENFDH